MNGILVINKPKNMTSRDVVNEVCKKLNIKKVGHTGTLDPIATGVLVLGINDGCKVIELLQSTEKEYIAKVKLGIKTDTLDVTGNIIEEDNNYILDIDYLKKVLNSFIGKYNQQVPLYSAVKVNGQRLYKYARNNENIVLPVREVEIKNIELLEYTNNSFTFKVLVSKGTYIRSLIDDISKKLNILCTMEELKRTKQGVFKIEDSIDLSDVNENIKLKSIYDSLIEYDKLYIDKELEFQIKNGRILDNKVPNDYLLILDKNNNLLAIYKQYEKDKTKMKPYKVF